MAWKLRRIARERRGKKRPRVFFQEWDEPVISAIGWVSELIAVCGGLNVFAGKAGAMAGERIVTLDAVARAKPDVIVGSWCGKPVDFNWLRSRPELAETPALKKNRLAEVDSAVILQPGPALFLDGVDKLFHAIHGF